jgi:hypothetical protein
MCCPFKKDVKKGAQKRPNVYLLMIGLAARREQKQRRDDANDVRRHIKWHRFRPGLRETLLTSLVDIKRRLCGIASVDV